MDNKFCCAIIPTYNNDSTLEKVATDVAQHVPHVIVVNDGSTDKTGLILDNLQTHFKSQPICFEVVNLLNNKGKGAALEKGFERAASAGFRYAITIDADGQHFAEEIPLFLEAAGKYPDSLIVGARNMKGDGVPGKSSFGNSFSNFWYRIETGLQLPDTQSGFRLYPLEYLKKARFFTGKFEFEIETLTRAAWQGWHIRSVPIQVYYAPEARRVSHFRPVRDFLRISLLNSVLVIIALLWIRPRNAIRRFRWQKTKRFFQLQIVSKKNSSLHLAFSAGFGIFMGITPIWGYQLLLGVTLAHFMKLNKAVVFIMANISIPPMIPIILYTSFLMGGLIVKNPTNISFDAISFEFVKNNFYQYLVGSIALAITAGFLVTMLVWMLVALRRKYLLKTKE